MTGPGAVRRHSPCAPGPSPQENIARDHRERARRSDTARPDAGSGGQAIHRVGKGGVAVTIFDIHTATLPAEGEVGVVNIGALRLENGRGTDDVPTALQREGGL